MTTLLLYPFGNALGNSIVAGLSAKSGNGQLSAKEQAALDQKMAAMDKKIQAKLNGQSGSTDPVIQMQSKNGVLVPQGSNAVEIFDWYKENGLLDGMDDQQYHKLALAANAYEDKQFARMKASMDHSQTLQQDLMRKQYSVDASTYRLAELTHEMKYYALGGHNGVFDQYGKDPKVTLIPWALQPGEGTTSQTPSLLAKFDNRKPGPWADGYVLPRSVSEQPKTGVDWLGVNTLAGQGLAIAAVPQAILEHAPSFKFGTMRGVSAGVPGLSGIGSLAQAEAYTWQFLSATDKSMKRGTLFTYNHNPTVAKVANLAGHSMFYAGTALSGVDAYMNLSLDAQANGGSARTSTKAFYTHKLAVDVAMGYVGVFGGPLGAAAAVTYFGLTGFAGWLWNDDLKATYQKGLD